MVNFQLFRLKIYKPRQINFYEMSKSHSEILKDVIFSLPSAEIRKGIIWNIGNVTTIDEAGIYFRVGRASKLRSGVYQNGNFHDQDFEMAPYTHVVLDIKLEICAIAKQNKLASKTAGIANQLARLLTKSNRAVLFRVEFEISEINDPEDFITHLRRAFAISRFWLTFSRPNPFDVNSDILKPLQKCLNETDGTKGKLELLGFNLKADSLEDITRSVASTGDEAGALLIEEKGQKGVRKSLKHNPVNISEDDLVNNQQIKTLLQRVRDVYYKIRGKSESEL